MDHGSGKLDSCHVYFVCLIFPGSTSYEVLLSVSFKRMICTGLTFLNVKLTLNRAQ